jgi:hypothetical protein
MIRYRKQTAQHTHTSGDNEQVLDKAVLDAIGESLHRVVHEKPAYHCVKGFLCTLE